MCEIEQHEAYLFVWRDIGKQESFQHNTKAFISNGDEHNDTGTNNNCITKSSAKLSITLNFCSFIRCVFYCYLCHIYWNIAVMVTPFHQCRWLKVTKANNLIWMTWKDSKQYKYWIAMYIHVRLHTSNGWNCDRINISHQRLLYPSFYRLFFTIRKLTYISFSFTFRINRKTSTNGNKTF